MDSNKHLNHPLLIEDLLNMYHSLFEEWLVLTLNPLSLQLIVFFPGLTELESAQERLVLKLIGLFLDLMCLQYY